MRSNSNQLKIEYDKDLHELKYFCWSIVLCSRKLDINLALCGGTLVNRPWQFHIQTLQKGI